MLASSDASLVGQGDEPGGGQGADDALDPGRGQVMHAAGQRPGTQSISPRGVKMTCRFMPCFWPGLGLRQHGPIAARCRRMTPAT